LSVKILRPSDVPTIRWRMLMCHHAFGMEPRDGLERDCKIAAGISQTS